MLWRFHELHHSQEDMSVLTVFRTHPLIHVSYLIALIPGIVLLANGALPTTLLVIYGGSVALRTRIPTWASGRSDGSSSVRTFHRIHHKLDGPQDVNLGFALTIWDQLFRRAVFPTPETIRTDTGLPGRPLIVEQATERTTSSFGFRRSARRAVPPDARPHETSRLFESHAIGLEENRTDRRRADVYQWTSSRPGAHRRTSDGLMVTTSSPTASSTRVVHVGDVLSVLAPRRLPADLALVAARIALAWIFIYYGAGKLFGCVQRTGIHRTALYFSNTAHLHPGGSSLSSAASIEFGGGIALALGLGLTSCRPRPVRGHGDGDDHGHLGDRHQFANVASRLPIEFGARCSRPRRRGFGGGRFSVDALA